MTTKVKRLHQWEPDHCDRKFCGACRVHQMHLASAVPCEYATNGQHEWKDVGDDERCVLCQQMQLTVASTTHCPVEINQERVRRDQAQAKRIAEMEAREARARQLIDSRSYFTVTRAVIVRLRQGCDKVYLETSLPEATYPFNSERLSIQFDVGRGLAENYLERHFPGLDYTLQTDAN